MTAEDREAMAAAKAAPRAVAVLNKSDLGTVVTPDDLPFDRVYPLSAKTGAGISELKAGLEALFGSDTPCDGSVLTNPRQAEAINRACAALDRTIEGLSAGFTPDALLTDVEEAMGAIGEVTGRTMREDITNRIFERFCVGK